MSNPFAKKGPLPSKRAKRATLAGLQPANTASNDTNDETPSHVTLASQAAALQRSLSTDSFASPPRHGQAAPRTLSNMSSPCLFDSPSSLHPSPPAKTTRKSPHETTQSISKSACLPPKPAKDPVTRLKSHALQPSSSPDDDNLPSASPSKQSKSSAILSPISQLLRRSPRLQAQTARHRSGSNNNGQRPGVKSSTSLTAILSRVTTTAGPTSEPVKAQELIWKDIQHHSPSFRLATKIELVTGVDLDWSQALPSRSRALAMLGNQQCTHPIETLDVSSEPAMMAASLQAGLQSWIFPTTPQLQKAALHSQDFKMSKAELQVLRSQWQQAMQGLQDALVADMIPIYYMCCRVLRVVMCAAGVGGVSEVHAIISKTSQTQRQWLSDEGIEYTLLHDLQAQDRLPELGDELDVEEDGEETDLKAMSEGIKTTTSNKFKHVDGKQGSSLLIKGDHNVHLLLDYLSNQRYTNSVDRERRVPPRLLAPAPFYHACMHSASVGACKQLARARKPTASGTEQEEFSTTIEGLFTPLNVVRLLEIIRHLPCRSSLKLAYDASTAAFDSMHAAVGAVPPGPDDELQSNRNDVCVEDVCRLTELERQMLAHLPTTVGQRRARKRCGLMVDGPNDKIATIA